MDATATEMLADVAASLGLKVCTHCGQAKSFGEFNRNRSKPGGLSAWCKVCTRAAGRIYKAKGHTPRPQKGYDDLKADSLLKYRLLIASRLGLADAPQGCGMCGFLRACRLELLRGDESTLALCELPDDLADVDLRDIEWKWQPDKDWKAGAD